MRRATFKNGVGRGVFVEPWMGRNGETILVAVDRHNRRLAEIELAVGDDHFGASERLWAVVERDDPIPTLKVI